ncbi:MAG: glutathione S-transferase family protein [Gammaproteobacteria bacterium]|nr:glutathione S-transferase family protein [Gammaproteobacteria bacterium]MDH3767762.1 glutathione S-transferase family protein [Gammaproteobacteria bacterium]
MKLYWCPRTRASRAVWLLEEAGVSYELVHIDIRNPDAGRNEAFLAASPMGKVPALKDGEVALADSAAIALYISDRYPDAGLAPAFDDPLRGRYLYWMLYTPAVIEPAMAEKVGGWKPNRGQHGWGDFDAMIKTLEQGLDPGPWLLGEQFSAADIVVGSSAVFLRMFDMLPDSPVIAAYADRCLTRPAYQRAMSLDERGA